MAAEEFVESERLWYMSCERAQFKVLENTT